MPSYGSGHVVLVALAAAAVALIPAGVTAAFFGATGFKLVFFLLWLPPTLLSLVFFLGSSDEQ